MSLRNSNDHYFDVTEPYQFERMAVTDLIDVIFDMNEDDCRTLLAAIATSSQFAARFPEPDFAAKTWKRFEPVIQAWVESKVEQAVERRGL